MTGEMYVVQLVQMSERARTTAAQVLGQFREDDLLDFLMSDAGIEKLRSDWDTGEPFAQLATRMRAALETQILPRLKPEHLRRLARDANEVAVAIGCAPEEATQFLFDTAAIRSTCRSVSRNGAPPPDDLGILLWTVASEAFARKLEMKFPLTDFGAVALKEKWLTPAGARALNFYAAEHGIEVAADPTRVLALLMEQTHGTQSGKSGQVKLDYYALNWLRQRFVHLAAQLKTQAARHLDEAVQIAPHLKCLRDLHARLELFELGAIARVLPYFITQTIPLYFVLKGERFEVKTKRPANPLDGLVPARGEPLIIENADEYRGRRGIHLNQPLGRFDVLCRVGDERVPLLHCEGLPIDKYEHLRSELPKIRGDYLSSVGEHLGERLLNTRVLKPEPFLRQLSKSIAAMGPAFIQALVLTGTLSIGIEVPWQEDLALNLPYSIPDTDQDTIFPDDIHSIVRRLRQEHPGARLVTTFMRS